MNKFLGSNKASSHQIKKIVKAISKSNISYNQHTKRRLCSACPNNMYHPSQYQKVILILLNVLSSLFLNNIKAFTTKNHIFNLDDFRILLSKSSKSDCIILLLPFLRHTLKMPIDSGGSVCLILSDIGSEPIQIFTDCTVARNIAVTLRKTAQITFAVSNVVRRLFGLGMTLLQTSLF